MNGPNPRNGMSAPTYSLVTVTRNNLFGLQRTVESILCQSCKDFELIVVDGNSSDGSKEYLATLLNNDRVCWTSEFDDGIYDAMNKGISRCRGSWILFLNAGDVFASNTVLENIKSFTGSDYAVLYGDYSVDGNLRWARPISYLRSWGMMTSHQAILFNRCVIGKTLIYDCGSALCGDFDLLCKILVSFPQGFKKVNCRIASVQSDGVSTKNFVLLRKEQARIVYRYFGIFGLVRYFVKVLTKSVKKLFGFSTEYRK